MIKLQDTIDASKILSKYLSGFSQSWLREADLGLSKAPLFGLLLRFPQARLGHEVNYCCGKS